MSPCGDWQVHISLFLFWVGNYYQLICISWEMNCCLQTTYSTYFLSLIESVITLYVDIFLALPWLSVNWTFYLQIGKNTRAIASWRIETCWRFLWTKLWSYFERKNCTALFMDWESWVRMVWLRLCLPNCHDMKYTCKEATHPHMHVKYWLWTNLDLNVHLKRHWSQTITF